MQTRPVGFPADGLPLAVPPPQSIPGIACRAGLRRTHRQELPAHGRPPVRGPEFHVGAGCAVQHPLGDPGDDAGRGLDADDRAARPPFDGLESDRSPVQRMPAIVNRAVLPDMGRMNARSASGAAIGYSSIPWPVPTRAPGSIRLSSVPRRTGSSPTPTCVTCLPNCPRRNPSPTSKPCCRPVSTPPPWPETHSKGCSPPHVNNALCGALTGGASLEVG